MNRQKRPTALPLLGILVVLSMPGMARGDPQPLPAERTPQTVREGGSLRALAFTGNSQEDRTRELLQSLDLANPTLQPVAEALCRRDLDAGCQALVRHFQSRTSPVWSELPRTADAGLVNEADEICRHIFRFVGCPPTQLGDVIQWNEDPHNYEQWPIALNRHTTWVTLGRAYAATRDEKYAREFVAELNGWIDSMPVYISRTRIEGPYFEPGKSPLTLDAGIRMAQTWWPAYLYFKDSPSFTAEAQFSMIRSLVQHARYLADPQGFHPASNWGAMELAGLFTLGVMLPEFKESAAWRRVALGRLEEARNAQVYPDGAQIELATGYHEVTLNNFLMVHDRARENGIPLPKDFLRGLESMFECYVALALPDGRIPSLNDGSWADVGRSLARGARLFPNRKDFAFFASGRRIGPPPARTSWSLPYAGWHTMRTGWGQDDLCLLFETGPYGAGHQHEDQLNILVHAGRKTILTEGGNYSYDNSAWRRYVLSTRAHNTARVDGLDQNRRTQRATWVVKSPTDAGWQSDAQFDYARGVYDAGYGPKNQVRVTHTRQVLFVKPEYWIVADTFLPDDAARHRYEVLFHLDASEAITRDGKVTVAYDGNEFQIAGFGPAALRLEIVQGRQEPEVQGWIPTGEHNKLKPIPTAIFHWEGSGPQQFITILQPRRAGQAWPADGLARSAEPAATGLQLTCRHSSKYMDHITLASTGRLGFSRTSDHKAVRRWPTDSFRTAQ